METFETVIVGAGPAGLKCAETLAKAGREVLVLETRKKPFRKICTGIWGFSEKTDHYKLPEFVFEKKFRKWIFTNGERRFDIVREKPILATLNRERLSKWQIEQARRAGAEIRFGCPICEIGENYVLANGKEFGFKNLVGADGSYSIVRKSLGLKSKLGMGLQFWTKKKFDYPEFHFDPSAFGPWYSWAAPYKNGSFIGAGCELGYMSGAELKLCLEEQCALKGVDISTAVLEGAPIQYNYLGHQFGNKFLTGDAAGFASAWTGEGIFFGMASGEDTAKIIIDKNHKPVLIDKILSVKRRHEQILRLLKVNRILAGASFSLGFSLLNYKFFSDWLVDLVC